MSTRESGIQGRIAFAILAKYGKRARVRVRHGTAYATTGDPDLDVCVDGFYFGFEIKNEEGELTRIQIHRIREIIDAGGIGAGIRTSEEALRIIDGKLKSAVK